MAEHYLKEELYDLIQTDSSIFEFLQKSSLDGLWYWDLENFTDEWMSPEFWTLLGVDPSEKQHKATEWQSLIHPEDLERALQNFNAHAADPTHPYDQVVRYKHADGSTVWVRCRGLIIRDNEGTPKRMLGAHNDLTAIKNAEQKLNQRLHTGSARHEELLAALDQIIWSCDTNFHIQQSVNKLEEYTGFTQQDLEKEQWINAVREEDRDCLRDKLSLLIDSPTKDVIELGIWSSAHQSYRHSELKIVPFVVHGALYEWILCLEDVHERVLMFNELEKSNHALRQTNAELEQFVYSASHDLKEPMRKASAFSQLLASRLEEEFPEALSDESIRLFLDKIQDSSSRMGELINNLLVYSRTGRSGDREWVDLHQVVKQVLDDITHLFDPKSMELELGPLPEIYICPADAYQLMLNLITNAIKYRRPDVRLSIRTGMRDQRIFVADNGIGIAAENRDRIFNLFERLHGRFEIEGTGIGLALCKKIVEQMLGSITVESIPNAGSCFLLAFPEKHLKIPSDNG